MASIPRNAYAVVVLAAVLSSGCSTLSMSGFQEAQVSGEGRILTAMIAVTKQDCIQRDEGNPYYDLEGEGYAGLETGVRGSITDRVEAGILFFTSSSEYSNAGIGVEGKAWIYDGDEFDAALQLGWRRAGVEVYSDNDYVVEFNDLFAGGLLTWVLSPSARLTLAPRLISREYRPYTSLTQPPTLFSDSGILAGTLLTLSFGKNFRVLPEIGWFTTEGVDILQYGIGVVMTRNP